MEMMNDENALPSEKAAAVSAGELTDEKAAEIMVAMREHMLAWGQAMDDAKPEGHVRLDIEDDEEEGFPAFAGECMRFLAPRLAEATRAAPVGAGVVPEGLRDQIGQAIADYAAEHMNPGGQVGIDWCTAKDIDPLADRIVALLPAAAATAHPVAADDQAHCRESLRRHAAKLEAVWDGIRGAVEKYSGQPCEGELLDRLDELLARLSAAHPARTVAADDQVRDRALEKAAREIDQRARNWLSYKGEADMLERGIAAEICAQAVRSFKSRTTAHGGAQGEQVGAQEGGAA
ncbi:hypothetical protein [Massilia sp.]|uniref:hypothetical protein n=1 Tax=Massilia sp. TaxID=1882437 RepID=UPI00289BAC49|nr:hypothetical protein [Massilia sp.]